MTGLEVILFLFSLAVGFVGGVAGWACAVERHKAQLVKTVEQRFRLLEQRSGNVDRPFGLTVVVRGGVVVVDAVLRGDHALWHAHVDVDVEAGVVVVVDIDWKDAVRAARGLACVGALTPRFAVYADDAGGALAAALMDRKADVCGVCVGAKAVVVEAGSVMVEVARDGLDAKDAVAVVARVVAAKDVIEGRAVAVEASVDVGSAGPSGCPFAVAAPLLA